MKFNITCASLQIVICIAFIIALLPITACQKENPVVPVPEELPEVSVWSNNGNLSWTFEDPYSDCAINFRYREVAIGDTVYSAVTGQAAIIREIIQ